MPKMVRIRHDVRMEAESREAEVLLYGEIIQNMPEEWKWSKEDKSAADFGKAIAQVKKDGAVRLKVRINSPGGIVSEAVAMRAILANAGFEELTMRIEGICASAATVIASIPGARVEIAEGSDYMIHNPWTWGFGEARDMEHMANKLRGDEAKVRAMYMARTGQDEETVKGWMDEEKWFSPEETVEYGFCDEVIRAKAGGEEAPIMACAGMREMMKGMYRNVPARLLTERAEEQVSPGRKPTEMNTPDEGEEKDTMDINQVTEQMLREGNPSVYDAIVQAGVQQERERMSEIDELTAPGYEQMAAEAKNSGESAMAFYKRMVKAQKDKGDEHMAARREESRKTEGIAGGAAEDESGLNEADMMKAHAKEMAELAQNMGGMGGMY